MSKVVKDVNVKPFYEKPSFKNEADTIELATNKNMYIDGVL